MEVFIYKAINKVNGKFYIGITKSGIKRRAYQHAFMASRGSSYGVFPKALRKYGINEFYFEHIASSSSWDMALDAERYLIKTLKPAYNVSAGGIGPMGVKWTDDRRRRAVESLRLAWTDERRAAVSAARKGIRPSKEAIEKMRAKNPWWLLCKPTICLNDGLIFRSAIAADEYYGLKRGSVSQCCNAKDQVSVSGLYFVHYKGDDTDRNADAILKELQNRVTRGRDARIAARRMPVECLNTGVIYPSAKAASVDLGLCHVTVCNICRLGGETNAGLRFRYVGHEIKVKRCKSPEELADIRKRQNVGRERGVEKNSKAVICIDDGVTYPSLSAAARAYSAAIESVSSSIRRNGRCKGRRFAFVGSA